MIDRWIFETHNVNPGFCSTMVYEKKGGIPQ